MSLRCFALACLLLVGCRHARSRGPVSPELAALEDLEDRRVLSDGQLERWARGAPSPALRARAVLALARVQDEASVGPIVAALGDAEPEVRLEAAFGAGVLGLAWQPLSGDAVGRLTQAVLEAEAGEGDASTRQALLKSLGQLATPGAVERLIERLKDPATRAGAALALGLSAKHEVRLPARAIWALASLLKPELDEATRYGAAYGLAQSQDVAAAAGLTAGLQDGSAPTRALCARGLGDVGSELSTAPLDKLLDDADWRVAVEATRALSKLSQKCNEGPCAPLAALRRLNARVDRLLGGEIARGAQPLLAFAQQPLTLQARPLLVSLRARLDAQAVTAMAPAVRGDVANVDCRLAAAIDRLDGSLQEVLRCGGGLKSEAFRLWLGLSELATSPAADPGARAGELVAYLQYPDSRVQLAALEALGATQAASAVEPIRPLLESADPVLAGAAAMALAKLKDRASIDALQALARRAREAVDIAPAVAQALEQLDAQQAVPELTTWLSSPQATVRYSAAASLSKLTGSKVVAPLVERPATGAVARAPLGDEQRLLVRTAKGEVQVSLFTLDAPGNARNLVALARRGYFRNLTFHRVVGDFVVQGADPRGDGEGGPGYTVRCELNRHPYLRGTVGLALGGKDTAGSQFFITHTATPHLDGRYTVVGEVTAGLEVVDQLLEGDAIIDVIAQP